MRMAIAVDCFKHPNKKKDYRVWYLELNKESQVIGIGKMSRHELVQSIFKEYQQRGNSGWRAFCSGAEHSKPIEIYDFVAMNMYENTHFGNLPTISEFQTTLDLLQSHLELRSIAS